MASTVIYRSFLCGWNEELAERQYPEVNYFDKKE